MKKNAEPKYLKIEDGIPLPSPRGYLRSNIALAMQKLKVGQSILTPQHSGAASSMANKLFGAGNYTAAREGNGTRIWRLK